jgi:microcystin-dependent protein
VLQTGDIKPRYGTGSHTGWVRCNGRTIGNSISGGTELADASAQALFQDLWNTDPNLVVPGGRGATSLADWNASKQMTLPDAKGTVLAGMDAMGGTPASRLTAAYFGANGDVLGARGGLERHLLTLSETPSATLSGNTGDDTPDHSHSTTLAVVNSGSAGSSGGGAGTDGNRYSQSTGGANNRHHHPFSVSNGGGDAAHSITQPTMVVSIYIKL